MSESLFLGVDGGGTGCRASLRSADGKELASARSGPANIVTDFQGSLDNILSATREVISKAGLPDEAVSDVSAFLGLAGSNIGDAGERIREKLPFRQCRIETDAVAALQGAIGEEDGVVAIIGTGTVYIYRLNGVVRTAGGWGFMVGDLASGAWLGRLLLQKVLLTYDGINSGSDLTKHVLRDFENNPQTVVEYAQTAKPGEFGKFAPVIFEYAEKRDPIALEIVRHAVTDIEETLDVILPSDSRFCMLGGLGGIYSALLSKHYREQLSEPDHDAVTGAAQLAIRYFGKSGELV
ncbi:MAG: BadF/BadG/BcrA/BcrD ATPase family protein [Rhizobiaceae bacterium]